MKYSARRTGRKRKRKVGSVNSKRDLGRARGSGPPAAESQLWREDQNVLARQRLVDLCKREAFGLELHLGLGHAHLVLELDRNRRILLAVLEQHEAVARLARGAQAPQHGLLLRRLMLRVDD